MKRLKIILSIFLFTFCTNVFSSEIEKIGISIQTDEDIKYVMININLIEFIYKFNEPDREEFSNFCKKIIEDAQNNKNTLIINKLAGNYNINSHNNKTNYGIYFIDTIPEDSEIKRQAFKLLKQIHYLTENYDNKKIISILNNVINEDNNIFTYNPDMQLPEIFPLERRNSLLNFFTRMDNHAGRGKLSNLYNISKVVENDNLIKAYDLFFDMTSYDYLNYGNKKFYDLEASIMNLEDFGAGYRAFEIWKSEISNLLSSLNLNNKPRIIELFNYIAETNHSELDLLQNNIVYFQPKVQRIVGEIFSAMRTDIPEGCLRCDGEVYQVSDYKYFVDKYLKTNKIPKLGIDTWNQQYKDNSNNCGYFGYDDNRTTFRTPSIQTGTFLTNTNPEQIGKFGWDKIPNIYGYISGVYTQHRGLNPGILKKTNFGNTYRLAGNGTDIWCDVELNLKEDNNQNSYFFNGAHIGTQIQPRNIQYPFFVIISEGYTETME